MARAILNFKVSISVNRHEVRHYKKCTIHEKGHNYRQQKMISFVLLLDVLNTFCEYLQHVLHHSIIKAIESFFFHYMLSFFYLFFYFFIQATSLTGYSVLPVVPWIDENE